MIPIDKYNHYYISNDGNIINKLTKRRIKNHSTYQGYFYNVLSKNYNAQNDKPLTKKFSNHRLVYLTWKGEIPQNMVINHKNGIKNDNSIKNLECCTSSENNKHAYDKKLKVFTEKMRENLINRNKTIKVFSKKVIDTKNNIIHDSILDCANYYGVSRSKMFAHLYGQVKINHYPHLILNDKKQ